MDENTTAVKWTDCKDALPNTNRGRIFVTTSLYSTDAQGNMISVYFADTVRASADYNLCEREFGEFFGSTREGELIRDVTHWAYSSFRVQP